MSILAGLQAIDALLSDERKWAKCTWATDCFGQNVEATSLSAVCWCVSGAAAKIGGRSRNRRMDLKIALALEVPNNRGLVGFNDHPKTSFADIKALLARAIEVERAKQPLPTPGTGEPR